MKVGFGIALGAFLALILLLAAFGDRLDQNISLFALSVSNPVFEFSHILKTSLNHVADLFFDKVRLQEENDSLREMVANLKGNIEQMGIMEKENSVLKEMLKYPAPKKIMARIIFSPVYALNDILILDVGRDSGIEIGMRVISPSGVFLGAISEVYDRTSKVSLASSFGQETNVYFENSGTPAIAIGIGGEMMKIMIPAAISDIEVGERVLTLDSANNLVGFVEKIGSKDTDPMQKIIFRSPLNASYLRAVLVF